MSNQLQPSGSWIRIDVVAMDDSVIMRQSARRTWADPDTYYNGQKHKEIVSIGDAVRTLSDPSSGSPEVATFTVEVNDFRGFWRGLLADWNTLHMSSQDFTYFFASSLAHSSRAIPHVEFRGQIKQPTLIRGHKFQVTAESRLGTRTGPFWIDGPVLRRGHMLIDLPNLPRVNWNKALAGLWGELSDEGRKNDKDEDIAQGSDTPTNCGIVPDGENVTPVYGQPPTLSVSVTGTGPSFTVDCVVVAWVVDGGATGLSNIVRVTNYPEVPTVNHFASWSWTYNGDASQIVRIGIYAKRVGIDGRFYALDFNVDVTNPPPQTTYLHNGQTPGDDHFGKAMYPPPPTVNTAVVGGSDGGGVPKRFYSLGFHEGEIISIYGKDLQPIDETINADANDAGTGRPVRTKVTVEEIGTTFNLGEDNKGVTKIRNGRTYFGFEASGPRADAHDDGSMPFQVNWCGRHDATGKVINQIALALLDILTQTLGNEGKGLLDAPITVVPSFRAQPVIPMFDTVSFETVQAQTIEEMATELGAICRIHINSFDVTYRSLIQGVCHQFGFDYGENNDGQSHLSTMSPIEDPTALTILRQRDHIKNVLAPGGAEQDQVRNLLRYQYTRAFNTFQSGVYDIKDADSIKGYGGEQPEDLDMAYIDDKATADWAAGRFIFFRRVAPSYPELECRFKSVLSLSLGDMVGAHHADLLIPDPIALYIRKRVTSEEKGAITLLGRDMTELLGSVFAPGGLGSVGGDPTDGIDDGSILLGDETSAEPYPVGALRLT